MERQAFNIIGFCMLFLSCCAPAAAEETGPAAKSWDDYKIITERNIFSRYRTKTAPVSQLQQPAVVVPEQGYYTLRGITKQPDGYISFIEDSRTAMVNRFRNGDSIAKGRITAITMDYISYENQGKTLRVEIGMNLEGQVSGTGMQYPSSGFGRSQGNAGSPVTGQAPVMGPGQGMGQAPGMDQTQTDGQFQGRGQGPAMGQFQSAGQPAASIQPQAMGQSQQAGQSVSAGQRQTTVNSPGAGQTGETAAQPAADNDEIMQRLKERRKKELE